MSETNEKTEVASNPEPAAPRDEGGGKGSAAVILISLVVLAGMVGLVVWGLMKASAPVKAPLQGQADARVIDVSPKIPGRLAAVHVREGDRVKAGDLLAEIDIPELSAKLRQVQSQKKAAAAKASLVEEGARKETIAAARAQYERAAAGLELARKTYGRVHTLFREGLVSAQKHDEARAALQSAENQARAAKSQWDMSVTGSRAQEKEAAEALARQAEEGVAEVASLVNEASVRAPRAGEVSRVVLHAGEVVPSGFPVITLIDHSDKWVSFNIREDDLPGIRVGTTLTAEIPALGRKDVRLSVYWISARADYATWRSTRESSGYDVRTFEVRCRPEQPLEDLRPGMSVLVPR